MTVTIDRVSFRRVALWDVLVTHPLLPPPQKMCGKGGGLLETGIRYIANCVLCDRGFGKMTEGLASADLVDEATTTTV